MRKPPAPEIRNAAQGVAQGVASTYASGVSATFQVLVL